MSFSHSLALLSPSRVSSCVTREKRRQPGFPRVGSQPDNDPLEKGEGWMDGCQARVAVPPTTVEIGHMLQIISHGLIVKMSLACTFIAYLVIIMDAISHYTNGKPA